MFQELSLRQKTRQDGADSYQGGAFLRLKTQDTLMDNNALLALWNIEDMPACPEGMMLARAFLISCGEGVNRLGTEEPADRITDLTACYIALVEHGKDCDNCNEV